MDPTGHTGSNHRDIEPFRDSFVINKGFWIVVKQSYVISLIRRYLVFYQL